MVYQEEETEAALELATCLADSLMDHFTEKGLLAKEIKVAEIVEMKDDDDAEMWDTSEDAQYTYYSESHWQVGQSGARFDIDCLSLSLSLKLPSWPTSPPATAATRTRPRATSRSTRW